MAKVKIRFDQTTLDERRNLIADLAQRVNVNESLNALIQTMNQYEAQFGMSTVEFYARYRDGKMGDGNEVMRWADAFDDYHALLQDHFQQAAA
ncbi:MAG: hypothetical protein HOP19_04295 [Acidobacteria bacterium]|nr:hypothetical protein [Acidobacteriota bacterium]